MTAFARSEPHEARRLGLWLLDRLVPPQCPLCGTPVERGPGLCPPCHSRLVLIGDPVHPVTGAPLPFTVEGDALDRFVTLSPPVYRRARAAVAFEGAGRDLVHALKYRDRHDCAPLMADLLAVRARAILDPEAVLVPVPLHWRRHWSRRFNQSALIADALARRTGLDLVADALRRVRSTRPQVGLGEADRRENVRRAFQVRHRRLPDTRGRTVILVDDVMTTGATVEAAARTLMEAGAFAVDVACFAKVVNDADLPL